MMHFYRGVIVVSLVFASAPAFGQEAAGRIKVVSGEAFIVRGRELIPAQAGQAVFQADSLRTGADGRIGVSLKDDTRLSLGPDTEISLQEFAFAPAEGTMSLVLRMVRGALSFVSGRIAKLSPSSVRIETPSSVIAVRGTHALIHVEGP